MNYIWMISRWTNEEELRPLFLHSSSSSISPVHLDHRVWKFEGMVSHCSRDPQLWRRRPCSLLLSLCPPAFCPLRRHSLPLSTITGRAHSLAIRFSWDWFLTLANAPLDDGNGARQVQRRALRTSQWKNTKMEKVFLWLWLTLSLRGFEFFHLKFLRVLLSSVYPLFPRFACLSCQILCVRFWCYRSSSWSVAINFSGLAFLGF